MKRTKYTRFDGLVTNKFAQGGRVDQYTTTDVDIVWPKRIERMFRYLRRFHPNSRYLLDWNPIHTPSFGHFLIFNDDLTEVTLHSKAAHFLRSGQTRITFSLENRFQEKVALRQLMAYFDWYADVCKKKETQ